jgi:DnaJ-class molecular chaperone
LFVALCCFVSLALAGRDFYKELGIERTAKDRDIKRAFRKLSVKYHPDKNPGDAEAQRMFTQIGSAYEVLSNPEKRQIYDIHGEEGLNKQGGGMQQHNPFASMFGMGGQGGGRKGPDYRMEFRTSLEELYNGGERKFKIARKVVCKLCRGTGAKGGETTKCKTCKGSGTVIKLQQLGPGFNVQMQSACDKCGGQGSTFVHKCAECKGRKIVNEEAELTAEVERGMKNGEKIVFPRMSEQSTDPSIQPGDVVLVLKTQGHARFSRRSNHLDLDHKMVITLKQALLGFTKTVKHLDGRDVEVKMESVTFPGQVLKLKAEGMPEHGYPSHKGDLYITFKIQFPKQLSEAQKVQVQTLL